jgi:hypothetical protein
MTPSYFREGLPEVDLTAARATAKRINERVGRARVQIRSGFIESRTPATPPPLTQLLRGGRGGEVKVKLLLSMMWSAPSAPYDVTFPARTWATLLGLPDPEGKGAARVNDAIRTLTKLHYVRAVQRAGQPSRVFLLNELGTGEPYSHPGEIWQAVKDADSRVRRKIPRYMQLPVDLWVNGWMAALSGTGLAMLLVLLDSARGKEPVRLWFSQSVAKDRYALTEPTRKRGLDELEEYGLITVEREQVVRDEVSTRRYRNTYTVHTDVFGTLPEEAGHDRIVLPKNRRRRASKLVVDFSGVDDDDSDTSTSETTSRG